MMKPHTHTAFDRDLEAIRQSVLDLGRQVETSVLQATVALENRDEALAAEVVRNDRGIDEREKAINTQVVHLLALRQPQADDLRSAIAVMKMAGDLERLGDYSKNIARRVPILVGAKAIDGAVDALRRQSGLVRQMLADMLDSFDRMDPALARDVVSRDVEVDEMTNALFRDFISQMMEDTRNVTPCLHYVFISKNIERMGDLITHGAQHVIYVSEGNWAEAREKGDSSATINVSE